METIIEISGVPYTFVTENGETRLRLDSRTTASEDTAIESLVVPDIWLVTRSNGVPLFALEPDLCDKPFGIMTANQLYAEKIQWFEPLADFYRNCLWVNPMSSVEGSAAHDAYKHHSWQSIINFAIVDRPAFMFHNGMSGDWKKQETGGDEYLLCLAEGDPYWADALGQIPYAVDTFRLYGQQTNDKDWSIRKTGVTGLEWANGNWKGEDHGTQNVYDNFMIIRGALWASENFHREISAHTYGGLRGLGEASPTVKTTFRFASSDLLKTPVSSRSLEKYKTWKP